VVTILGNLIDNALDAVAGQPHKKVTLRFDYYDDILVLEVHDTGQGIDDEIRNCLFIKGYSTKGENRGIGLYLVQRSLEKLTGSLEIHSKKEKGTTFICSFPYKSKQ
jgi:two-component system, CitB family, sensor histidine kinase MalK